MTPPIHPTPPTGPHAATNIDADPDLHIDATSPPTPAPKAPVSAIVIFRHEREDLQRCLPALAWCDELIAIRMGRADDLDPATGECRDDGSLDVARQHATRVYHVDPYPIAEPTRVAAADLATHDWLLYIDPDETIPPRLARQMRGVLKRHPDVAAVNLPMWFYFKRKRLVGTIWGALTHKRRLIHRQRCEVLPWCNRLNALRPGQREITIEHDGDNHIRHFWSDSHLDLAAKHILRYSHTEAQAMAAEGVAYSAQTWFDLALRRPLTELKRSLRDYDGWRLGPRGWLLSAIYFAYVAASHWLVARYQHRQQGHANSDDATLDVHVPELRPDPLPRELSSDDLAPPRPRPHPHPATPRHQTPQRRAA